MLVNKIEIYTIAGATTGAELRSNPLKKLYTFEASPNPFFTFSGTRLNLFANLGTWKSFPFSFMAFDLSVGSVLFFKLP
jgi:hypothetical protein